jgi:hypothetical protein
MTTTTPAKSGSSSATILLPELHPGQLVVERGWRRFNALACGRRWGKSKYLTRRMALRALRGESYGYFAPTYKILKEVFSEAGSRLSPVANVLRSEKRIEIPATGGLIEFWTLEDEDAGRSRKYHEVGIDEAGLVKDLEGRWHNAIRPTLTDYQGEACLAGTPKGRNFFHTAFALGQDPLNDDWSSWQMPTATNTKIPNLEAELEAARSQMPERSFRQEYLAEFLDEAGGVFRGVREVVVQGATTRSGAAPYSIGVDLARVADYTVVTVVDSDAKQVYHERFNQISWERQEAAIRRVYEQFPGSRVWIDSTGVGDPIFERLRSSGMSIEGYHLSNASKESLINNLALRIEQREVSLLDIPVQTEELLAYQYELTPSRNVRMNAPAGMHDDTVIALALAVWGVSRRKRSWGEW